MNLELNQKLETILKSGLALLSIVLALIVDAATANLWMTALSAAAPLVLAIYFDVRSTIRLAKQGIVSTDPAVNVATEMTPAKLVAEEKAEAKADAKAEAKKS